MVESAALPDHLVAMMMRSNGTPSFANNHEAQKLAHEVGDDAAQGETGLLLKMLRALLRCNISMLFYLTASNTRGSSHTPPPVAVSCMPIIHKTCSVSEARVDIDW